ncbi:major facilitator superfamily domain-containing protein [Trichoderma pleuroticola]
MASSKGSDEEIQTTTVSIESDESVQVHYAKRGEAISNLPQEETIDGFRSDMAGRTLLTAEEEKKLLRRVDWHLMPLCSLIFLFKNLDSDNVSNARIMNRGTDQNIMTQLGMTSDEYNLVTVLYYIPYIVGEAPSNLLLKYFTPSKWQSRIIITWGICLMLHAAVHNKGGLYATRFLLGLVAFWLLPLITHQAHTDFLDGNVPETASWLTDTEKAFIQARLPENAPRANEQNFKFSEIVDSLKDVRLWLFTLIWAIYTIGTNGVRFYQSTVIANLGFTNIATAQILNLPITATSLIVIGVSGVFADSGRYPRPLYPLGCLLVIIACYAVLVAYPNNAGVYTATLIGNAFAASWYPLMWPWRVQTTSRATGSAFSIGFVNSYGQIGGAIGPQIFRSKYAPHYTVPFAVAMSLVALCFVVTIVTWWVTRHTESDTRRLKLARKAAEARNETVLEDVVDRDLR